MSPFGMAFRFFSTALVFLKLLIFINGSRAETGTTESPVISASVANYICKQHNEYQETSEIQLPLKERPENDDSECGWYLWSKCADSTSESKSESCPSFLLKPCDKIGKTVRKGKGIIPQEKQFPPDPCDNATEQGLPNPELVTDMSKYPSVVTIGVGDRCQKKYCTGIILNADWIIVQQTGCFFLYQPQHSDLYVVVAAERRMYVEDGTEQRRSVAEYIPHPGFNITGFRFYKDNIGLARVSTPFEFNENVQPIDLAVIETIAPSIPKSTLKIVGWLYSQPKKEEDEMLASLIESPLDFVPIDECYDKEMEGDKAPRDSLLCAGKCITQGDKKKQPLRNIFYAQESSESVPVPVGIGPIKHKDRLSEYGVFMNLAFYIPWIKETVQAQGQSQSQTTESPEPESRIIGGEEAAPYKYKSLVNIESYVSYACTKHFCGGNILSEEWFLTAAHCVDDWETEQFRFVVGDYDISDSDQNEQVVNVSKVILHEDYNSTVFSNDIAVVKVTPPFKFNDKIQNVTLPDPSFETKGPLTAVGWGQTNNFIYPHILREVEVPVTPLDECKQLYNDSIAPTKPLDTTICAGNATGTICFTDSGGPLYYLDDQSGEQIVVGLGSFGSTDVCRLDRNQLYETDPRMNIPREDKPELRPHVFTKVASYIDWIMKNAEMTS